MKAIIDTYDGFYNQPEEKYKQEYGDDYADAIDDAYESSKR